MRRQSALKTIVILLAAAAACIQAQTIAVNSIGFLPDAPKIATLAAPCTRFEVKSSKDKTVLVGKAVGPFKQDDIPHEVWLADFSALKKPGTYYIEIAGVGKSPLFRIGKNVYADAFYTAMRAMYLWRCGTAVQGEHNGNVYRHEACHLDDGYEDYLGRPGVKRDGVGGWHDAGDYGKYVVNAGITVGCLFLAWEHFQPQIEKVKLDLPETAPGYPEYLKEIKWEIDWLLKMAYPDGSGRVSHKLTRTNFEGFVMPEADDGKRFFTEWSSAATADFAAMTAMAARIFQPYDAAYAQRCLEAAKQSYAYLQEHPENVPFRMGDFRTGAYATHDADDRIWAAAELWETTGDPAYLMDFEKRSLEYRPQMRRGEAAASENRLIDDDWDWGNVRNLGSFTYLLSKRPGKNAELYDRLKTDLLASADSIAAHARRDVYGRPLERYYWGCNGTVARQVLNLQVAYRLSPKADYRRAVLDALAHLFGRNVYGRSYVTGLGHNPPLHPHDRRSGADTIEAPWPGYLVGGGHSATGWVDEEASYATNEIAVNWQAALIYALAGFLSH
ncbi:MAG: glycoside hydrolase family 9 protein [candidate division KSB1 bacterium]|nr:glycoside hydrolase family 9 protein [candidate division KSB1 bacterium]